MMRTLILSLCLIAGLVERGSAQCNFTPEEVMKALWGTSKPSGKCKNKDQTASANPMVLKDDESRDGKPGFVDVCRTTTSDTKDQAFFWLADMDVDCDGRVKCKGDPSHQGQTSLEGPNGPLDATRTRFIVIPDTYEKNRDAGTPNPKSTRFDYREANIQLGAVAAVILQGDDGLKMDYGIFGDEGPYSIIGEASSAMAKALDLSGSAKDGGTDKRVVTYVVFNGDAVLPEDQIEKNDKAAARAKELICERILKK